MNVDQFVSQYVPQVSDMDCFRNFSLDMTQSMIKEWDANGRVVRRPVMAREPGQKESERQLYTLTPRKPSVADKHAERQARLDALAAQYAGNAEFELEITDYVGFATGLAKACHTHGVDPSFLLDEDGEL